MYKKKLEKIKKEELIKLSKKSQESINSINWEEISRDIGIKYLIEKEIESFQIEILLVLIGLKSPYALEKNIENNIITSKEEAIKITNEVIEKIFKPMVEKITLSNTKNNETTNNKSNHQTDIYKIGKKYNLHINQIGILEKIINKVTSGELSSKKIDEELKSKIEIPENTIVNIINDVNNSIFKDIRNNFKSEWEKKNTNNTDTLNSEKNNAIPTPPYKKEVNDIPLPPYKKLIIKDDNNENEEEMIPIPNDYGEVPSKKESDIYAESGIEITKEGTVAQRNNEKSDEVEKDILENTEIDLIGEKLNKPTVSDNTISDYSLPKISSLNKDLHREDL